MLKTIFRVALCLLSGAVATAQDVGTDAAVQAETWKSPHDLQAEHRMAVIPFPQRVEYGKKGALSVSGKGWHFTGDVSGKMVQAALKDAGFTTKGKKGTVTVTCRLEADALPAEHAEEGYVLEVSGKDILIKAVHEAGLFNGLQTLRQLVATSEGQQIPVCTIKDWPAFRYRGYMQDCGRNFRSVARLKKELELAALLKVNLFHWHLTDNPAWHVECKAYPRLNDPKFRTRDKDDTYTYAEIREVFEYAAERNILIIPELDMPGHSAYFNRTFGFAMHSEEGMKIVGELLEEFCREIPKEMCPIVHFGADEVKIPNAPQFVGFVTQILQKNGRTPMQWSSTRDLPVGEHSIEQRWGEGADMVAKSIVPERIKRRAFDSTMGYSNLLDPALLVRRYFFMRPCGSARGDDKKLGTIICIWPDGKVDDKAYIPGMCTMWPGLMAMVERSWQGGAANGDALPLEMPAADTPAGKAYASFEQRMQQLRRCFFEDEAFRVEPESGMSWTVVEPVATAQADAVRKTVLSGDLSGLATRPAHCANLYFRTRPDTGYLGMFSGTKPGHTVWAVTTVNVKKAGKYKFMVGFDAPARSNRRYSGVPENGKWSQCGTRIWLNGKELQNPRTYRHAGKNRLPGNAWQFEKPLELEEVWWMLDPVEFELQQGDNTFIIEQPYIGEFQSWGVSLIPVKD
ncbi:MAG: family 20 glycosylhydrolase [Akkermansia sp.]|nr:family 20 glycosylhydrolase [Akkermansia sp.]